MGWTRCFLLHTSWGDLHVIPHLVALIDAIDELGAGRVPGEADGGGVGGLGLHVARGHSGHWKDGGSARSSSGSAGSPPSAQGPGVPHLGAMPMSGPCAHPWYPPPIHLKPITPMAQQGQPTPHPTGATTKLRPALPTSLQRPLCHLHAVHPQASAVVRCHLDLIVGPDDEVLQEQVVDISIGNVLELVAHGQPSQAVPGDQMPLALHPRTVGRVPTDRDGVPTLHHRCLPDDVALEDTILVALRGWLPLDHDGLVGAAAGDDVLGGCRGRLLGQGHSKGHQVRMSAQPNHRHMPHHHHCSPLRVLAELTPAHIIDSTQAELVGTGRHQPPHHHPCQLRVNTGQQHCPGCICGEKAMSRWGIQPAGFLHPLPTG